MNINKDELNTGDLLLFHHVSNYKNCFNCFFSCFTSLIQSCTHSKYSHIGIVVKDPTFTNPPLKGLYVLESSFELYPDVEDHKYKLGVELEEFDKVIRDANEDVYLRKLNCDRNENFFNILADVHKITHNKPYDVLPKDWIDALFHKYSGKNAQSTKQFWCSALVAYIYVRWGFLPSYTPWSLLTPKMFSTEDNGNYKIKFLNCKLGDEIKIN
jgi:hypothetical protein